MSKLNLDERTIYARMSWDETAKKKKVFFGGSWGSMSKADANAIAFKTGDGLVVVDVDTKDLSEIDKGIRKELKKLGSPTVETARGYHWYFEHKNSAEFVNKASYSELVDVRSDGGIIFSQYRGKNPNIMYKRVGQIYKKMPAKLHDVLKKAMKSSRKKVKKRTQWSKIEKGGIHDGCISYAINDFKSGLELHEVMANGIDYVNNYLGGTAREMKLMTDRIKWAYETKMEEKLAEAKPVPEHEPMAIGGEFEDDEVLGMLKKAEKGGAVELERVMKEIKKKLKISIGTQREMVKEARVSGDLTVDVFFKGEIVWDSALECFVEIGEKFENYYRKGSFNQTVMSLSGYLSNTDVSEMLPSVPAKRVLYIPTAERGDMIDTDGHVAYNVHQSVAFTGKGKKIPKTINKVLDNLFLNDPKAKDVFVNWMGAIVQHGIRTGVAWGFFGASGTGKGLIVDVFRRLLGDKNCSLNVSDNDLQSAFSPYLMHKQFVHLNEVASDFHGRHGVAGHIKAFISDPTIRINKKNVSEMSVDNFCNTIMNSNKPNPIELDRDDRRWNMIIANRALTANGWWKGNKTYQKAMSESDEFGAYLMNMEVDLESARTPMEMSVAKQSVIDQTTSTQQQIGDLIKKGDADGILEALDVTDDSLGFDEEAIRLACDRGEWPNHILTAIYQWMVGERAIKGMEVRKFFIVPYISSTTKLLKRDGKVNRCVIVDY